MLSLATLHLVLVYCGKGGVFVYCKECYWCRVHAPLGQKRVCCNKNSKFYNQVFSLEETENRKCDFAETEQAVDYHRMTAWQFASKYYM